MKSLCLVVTCLLAVMAVVAGDSDQETRSLPFSSLRSFFNYAMDNYRHLSWLSSPDVRKGVAWSLHGNRNEVMNCLRTVFRRAFSAQWPTTHYNLVQMLNSTCRHKEELLVCYDEVVLEPLRGHYSKRGGHLQEAMRAVLLPALERLCGRELGVLADAAPEVVTSCMTAQYWRLETCLKDFAQDVAVGAGDYHHDRAINGVSCSKISTMSRCIEDTLDACDIPEISAAVSRAVWEVTTSVDCSALAPAPSPERREEAASEMRHMSRAYIKWRFQGIVKKESPSSFNNYMAKYYTTFMELARGCENVASFKPNVMQSAKQSRECLMDYFKEVIYPKALHDQIDHVRIIGGICKYPHGLFHCFDLAFSKLSQCFTYLADALLVYSRKVLSELLYVVCVEENAAWEAINPSLLNGCVVTRGPQLQSCLLSFGRKFLAMPLATGKQYRNSLCYHTWEMFECIEEELVHCATTGEELQRQLEEIKEALANRLECSYQYNAGELLRTLLKEMAGSLYVFGNLSNIEHAYDELYDAGNQDYLLVEGRQLHKHNVEKYNSLESNFPMQHSNQSKPDHAMSEEQILVFLEYLQERITKRLQERLARTESSSPLTDESHTGELNKAERVIKDLLGGDCDAFYRTSKLCRAPKLFTIQMKIFMHTAAIVSSCVDALTSTSSSQTVLDNSTTGTLDNLCRYRSWLMDCYMQAGGSGLDSFGRNFRRAHWIVVFMDKLLLPLLCSETRSLQTGVTASDFNGCFRSQSSLLRQCVSGTPLRRRRN